MTSRIDPSSNTAAALARSARPLPGPGRALPQRDLEDVLRLLDRYHQRATYGAVAGLLNRPARSVMAGQPKDPLHSWVVSGKTHQPTGYHASQFDPALFEREDVFSTAFDLDRWLDDPY